MPRSILAAVLLWAGCAQPLDVPNPDASGSTRVRPDSPAAERTQPDVPAWTHVVAAETVYYTTGPQQGRPPDGKFAGGTPVGLVEEAGSYVLVHSAEGITAYVAADAVKSASAAKLPPEIDSLVQGNTAFACDLYARLAETESGNLFFSPASISTALGMTYAGARAETAAEMAETLHFALPPERLHAAFAKLNQVLNAPSKDYQLSIANRLWGQRTFTFLPEFLQVTRKQYGAELAAVDFQGQTEAARRQINAWVEQQTRHKIQDLIPAGAVDSLTRLVLTNAIYFKGRWSAPFDKKATRAAPFHVSAEREVDVPMMSQTKSFGYASVGDVQLLELPYGKQQHLAMIVLLPQKIDGLAELERQLSAEKLRAWTTKLTRTEVQVYLPKFQITSEFSLNASLEALGMRRAFDPEQADFSGMSSQDKLFVSAALHKAFVEVNEEGTEAAAATGIVIGVLSERPEPPVFRADHPFAFLIRDNRTGSILFLGRFVGPG